MEKVCIHTAQNVDIEYEVSHIGDRIIASLVDYFIIFIYSTGVLFGMSLLNNIVPDNLRLLYLFFALPLLLYDLFFELFMSGQSPGKKIMRIKVVMREGGQPVMRAYLIRWMLRLIDVTILSGFVAVMTILLNGKGQRLGDIAAGTMVVKLRKKSLDDTILAHVEESYRPRFSEAGTLTDRESAIIKDVLDFNKNNRNGKSSREILARTKANLELKLGISTNMDPAEFLQTLLKDYNSIHGRVG